MAYCLRSQFCNKKAGLIQSEITKCHILQIKVLMFIPKQDYLINLENSCHLTVLSSI